MGMAKKKLKERQLGISPKYFLIAFFHIFGDEEDIIYRTI